MTDAYDLPCRKVIHAVGPVYRQQSPEESARLLAGCYTRSLELAVENGCRTIAFPAISTGVYGHPSREAAPAALGAIRQFLEGLRGEGIERVLIVTFKGEDEEAYKEFLPRFFPPAS
ncbi:hypothetical protein C8A03DRAFT_38065 [Achaetomium macrosporum]|uniref:Macro domain-containing protein n=1 Tax=Achaetomium macrosporum TaxID=79813 RepID=A0AAN7H7Y3_9PEZI|nr:hypothetical protein C8A03DRAFT_38065 [Achaetomium macrosporum]